MIITAETAKLIGKTGRLKIEKLIIVVEIQAVRPRYGKLDYLVSPVNGGGVQWVESTRVTDMC